MLRLIQYIDSTPQYRLVTTIKDNPEDLELRFYVDADFAGDRPSGKSTSGGYLVLYGPNSFFPLAWVSKRQTSTSRSRTESEVVSLAHSLYQEGLPALQLWELLLGRTVTLPSLGRSPSYYSSSPKRLLPKAQAYNTHSQSRLVWPLRGVS